MADTTPSISLTIRLPDGSTKVLEFNTGDPIMVGSGASSHVKIDGDDVSSLHCMIKPRDGKVYVLDLGSDEGTELNGKEVKGETVLDDGDQVSVGRAKITVHFGGDMLAPTVPIRRVGHEAKDETTVPVQEAPPKIEAARTEARKPEVKVVESNKDDKKPARDSQTEIIRERKTATSMPARVVHAERSSSKSGFRLGKQSDHRAKRSMDDTGGTAALLSATLTSEQKPVDTRGVDVTAMWGGTVIGVARLSAAGTITIGDAPTSNIQVSHASIGGGSHALVSSDGNAATVNIASGMEATVDGATANGQVRLALGQVAKVRVGPIEFVVQYSKRSPTLIVGISEVLDFFYSKVLAIALILQMGLVVAMMITPSMPSLDDDDLFKNNQEFTKLILQAQEKKKEKKEDLSGKKAAKAKLDEGAFGKKDKPKEDKVASKKGAPTVDKDKREEDRKIAMDALAALGLKGPEGAVSNVFGPGGLGSGVNNALGGLKGASMGDAGGAGGLGSRGTGAGGGGNGLGIGGLGSGTGRGSGGNGNIDLGGRGKGTTKIVPGKIIYEGGLSREEIQRVISRVMSQIKYCYEKELTKDPNLEGKLVMFWVITGSGDVSSPSATQNTFSGGSAQPVEQCVSRIIQRLKFPQPKGGGIVNVTYPFVFSASGG